MCQNRQKLQKKGHFGVQEGWFDVIFRMNLAFGMLLKSSSRLGLLSLLVSKPIQLGLPVARSMIAVSFRRKVPLLTAALLPDASKWSCQIDFKAEYDPPAWLWIFTVTLFIWCPLCFHFPSLPCRGDPLICTCFFFSGINIGQWYPQALKLQIVEVSRWFFRITPEWREYLEVLHGFVYRAPKNSTLYHFPDQNCWFRDVSGVYTIFKHTHLMQIYVWKSSLLRMAQVSDSTPRWVIILRVSSREFLAHPRNPGSVVDVFMSESQIMGCSSGKGVAKQFRLVYELIYHGDLIIDNPTVIASLLE